jgi:hypothetical protein
LPELPFSVRLRNFRLEHYPGGTVWVQDRAGQSWKLRAEVGETRSLGDQGTIRIEKVFENWKMDISGDERVAFDAPGGYNPAVEITHEKADGSKGTRFVFAQQTAHMNPNELLHMSYQRMVSDYISELEVIEDGQVVAQKDIEVNHPLHYGGYHFYQHQWGRNEFGEYTVLMVVADSGLWVVYIGYAMLIAGICWHFWGRIVLTAARTRSVDRGDPAATPNDKKRDNAGGTDGN